MYSASHTAVSIALFQWRRAHQRLKLPSCKEHNGYIWPKNTDTKPKKHLFFMTRQDTLMSAKCVCVQVGSCKCWRTCVPTLSPKLLAGLLSKVLIIHLHVPGCQRFCTCMCVCVCVCVCVLIGRLSESRMWDWEKVQLFVTVHVQLLKRSITSLTGWPPLLLTTSDTFNSPFPLLFLSVMKLDVLHAWFARSYLLHLIHSLHMPVQ